MTLIARRSFLVALSAASVSAAGAAHAVDALPDARFVGFAQAVNDFGVGSGNLALARSGNENVRGYATRSIAEHNEAASELTKSRQEAGVAYAPDGRMVPHVQNLLGQLSTLQRPDFDAAFASAQLMVQTTRSSSTAPIPRTAAAARCAATRRGRTRSRRCSSSMPSALPAGGRTAGGRTGSRTTRA